jgi:phosphoribosylformimino-5-aminoimidazole carboxamide ribotide isomerase
MKPFTIYPAIDLRNGEVVRLKYGDPSLQTTYPSSPVVAAQHWIELGASWLHVVNLDGAFADQDTANQAAIRSILEIAIPAGVHVQLGGGIRDLTSANAALKMGVNRIILGTIAVEKPTFVAELITRVGASRVVIGVDARHGLVRTRGWQTATTLDTETFAQTLKTIGVETIIFTDIQRDGVGGGVNLESTRRLAQASQLQVIASGGIHRLQDVQAVKDAALPGVVIGRALYEGTLDPQTTFALQEGSETC